MRLHKSDAAMARQLFDSVIAMEHAMPDRNTLELMIRNARRLKGAAHKRTPRKPVPVKVEVRALTPKHEAQIATAMVRAAVWTRAGSRCEVCGAPAAELHHLCSGPDRKPMESADTCVALCWRCHKRAHKGWEYTLNALHSLCCASGMHEARKALERRIAKVKEAQQFSETTR